MRRIRASNKSQLTLPSPPLNFFPFLSFAQVLNKMTEAMLENGVEGQGVFFFAGTIVASSGE